VGRGPALALALVAPLTCALACDVGQPGQPRYQPELVAPAPDFTSGTRLRARYHVVDGFFRVFVTFHDAQLDVDCAYEDEGGAHVGPGASSYCFPAGMAQHREGTGPFFDLTCTEPVAFAPQSGAASYVVVQPRDACVTAPAVFAALPPRNERTFTRDTSGACKMGPRGRVQHVGGRLPAETFVRAVEQTEPRAGLLDARVLVGDDGSRRVVGGFDRQRLEALRAGTTEDGQRRWVPVRTAFVGAGDPSFDATCAAIVATKIGRTATCPLSAAVVLEGTCGGGRYFALGDQVAAPFQRDATNACVATAAPDFVAFRLGAPIAASAYVPVSSFEIGTPRVRRRGLGASSDQAVTWGELVDAATNETCEVVETADGSLRCLPAAAESVSFFADAACTAPAFARATTGCETGAAPTLVHDTLQTPARAFLVGAELTAIYALEGTRCTSFTPTVTSRMFAAAEVATTMFPLATPDADFSP
jgi:hypothetical protein